MRIVAQGNRLIMSHPESSAEKRWLDRIHQIATATGRQTLEFAVSTMAMNDVATHVGLEPIVPEELSGDRCDIAETILDERCHICGGPNH